MAERPCYERALLALTEAHAALYRANSRLVALTNAGIKGLEGDVLGMSSGPFSGVNEVLGIVARLEEENQRLKAQLAAAHAQGRAT